MKQFVMTKEEARKMWIFEESLEYYIDYH